MMRQLQALLVVGAPCFKRSPQPGSRIPNSYPTVAASYAELVKLRLPVLLSLSSLDRRRAWQGAICRCTSIDHPCTDTKSSRVPVHTASNPPRLDRMQLVLSPERRTLVLQSFKDRCRHLRSLGVEAKPLNVNPDGG